MIDASRVGAIRQPIAVIVDAVATRCLRRASKRTSALARGAGDPVRAAAQTVAPWVRTVCQPIAVVVDAVAAQLSSVFHSPPSAHTGPGAALISVWRTVRILTAGGLSDAGSLAFLHSRITDALVATANVRCRAIRFRTAIRQRHTVIVAELGP